MNSSPLSTLSH